LEQSNALDRLPDHIVKGRRPPPLGAESLCGPLFVPPEQRNPSLGPAHLSRRDDFFFFIAEFKPGLGEGKIPIRQKQQQIMKRVIRHFQQF